MLRPVEVRLSRGGLALAVAAMLLAFGVTIAQEPQDATQDLSKYKTTIDAFRSLPLEEQSRRLTQAAEGGFFFGGLDTPREFQLLASDKALENRMDGLTEPLPADWLDALEELLHRDTYDQAKFRAAVLLYRHGRDAGRAYLMNLLDQDHDVRAALAFSIAKEPGSEQGVIDVVLLELEAGRSVARIAQALERWRNPKVGQILNTPKECALFKAHNRFGHYLNLVGGDKSALQNADTLKSASDWKQTVREGKDSLTSRLYAAKELVRTDPADREGRAFLLDELATHPFGRFEVRRITEAIAETSDPRFIDPLLVAIARFVADQPGETRDQATERVETTVGAVEAVVRLGGDVPEGLAARVYDALPGHVLAGTYQRLDLALLQTTAGREEAVRRMQIRLGEEETSRILAMQQLKPVPDPYPRYVPRSSRGWVWQ